MDYDFKKMYDSMSTEDKAKIRALHRVAEECVEYLDALAKRKEEFKEHPTVVRTLNNMIMRSVEDLENLEFAMQNAWGIPTDPNYHTWWLYPTQCLCPKMDNRDPMFFGAGKIIAGDCPIHGDFNLESDKQ